MKIFKNIVKVLIAVVIIAAIGYFIYTCRHI